MSLALPPNRSASYRHETLTQVVKLPKFLRFALIWYAEQFAIPFWIVGHVHLHFADYHAMLEAGASALMHIAVGWGFWLGWKEYERESESS